MDMDTFSNRSLNFVLGCALSPVLFVIFMVRISRRRLGGEGLRFGGLGILLLLFADDVVFLSSSVRDLQWLP